MLPALLIIGGVFVGAVFAAYKSRPSEPPDDEPSGEYVPPSILEVALSRAETVAETVVAESAKVFGTKYDALIESSARQYGIDPDILYRLLWKESRFREDIITGKVKSPAGALGIAQFMPATARELKIDPLDPAQAIPGAARYLASLIRQTGSIKLGLAAYNWGIGNVTRRGVSKAPEETRQYVAFITGENLA